VGFSVRSIPHRWHGVLRDPNKSRYCGQRTEDAPAISGIVRPPRHDSFIRPLGS